MGLEPTTPGLGSRAEASRAYRCVCESAQLSKSVDSGAERFPPKPASTVPGTVPRIDRRASVWKRATPSSKVSDVDQQGPSRASCSSSARGARDTARP